MAYLPGEILFGYAAELDEKARIVSKTSHPNLSDYDGDYDGILTYENALKWLDRYGGNVAYDFLAGGEAPGRNGDANCDDGAELTVKPPAGKHEGSE